MAERARCPLAVNVPDGVVGVWDRLAIEQVLDNLLSNALKFGAGQAIDVDLAAEGSRVRVTVRDRGPGISAEDQARIFGRFEQAMGHRRHGGFGIGLWLVPAGQCHGRPDQRREPAGERVCVHRRPAVAHAGVRYGRGTGMTGDVARAEEDGGLRRVTTGVPGLDDVLHGGLFTGGAYILQGASGAGKTTLANQICFHHARTGGRALFVIFFPARREPRAHAPEHGAVQLLRGGPGAGWNSITSVPSLRWRMRG